MITTDTSGFDTLRSALLELHKTLLDAQRVRYEREYGRIESRGELLDLVLRNESFEWLRVLSALIAQLDELTAVDDRDAGAEMRAVIDKLRALVRFEGNRGFTDPYREIIEGVPDALVAHVQLSRLLADFGAARTDRQAADVPNADLMPAMLIGALAFAADKHRNQRSKDAEASPYINHPIILAKILSIEAGVEDGLVLCAAVLHDTIEDTEASARLKTAWRYTTNRSFTAICRARSPPIDTRHNDPSGTGHYCLRVILSL